MSRAARALGAAFGWLVAGAVLAGGEFRWERDVLPAGPGVNRLDVDIALLAGAARDGGPLLADLRLFSRNGSEVPYLLVAPPSREPVWVPGRVIPVPVTRMASGFEVDLGSVQEVDRLALDGLGAPLLKRLVLEGSGDRVHWITLVAEGTLFNLPDEGLRCTELAFSGAGLRYLRVTWNDAKSGRVALPSSARARLVGLGGGPERVEATVAFARRGSEPGVSRFRIRLPGAGLPIVALRLSVGDGNLLRGGSVSESRLVGATLQPEELGRTVLRQAAREGLVASSLTIPIRQPREAEIDLVVEDGSNPPLDLREVRALLPPQPTIAFDAPDATPMVARFGAPGLAAPRYDLEVTRSDLERRPQGSLARWGDRREAPEIRPGAAPRSVVSQGATLEGGAFAVSRPIPPGPLGLTALKLDAAVVAGSRDLADVRIIDASNVQVPYVVELLGEPLTVSLGAAVRSGDPRSRRERGSGRPATVYRVAVSFTPLPASRLLVESPVRVFERAVDVFTRAEGWRDSRGDGHPGPSWRTVTRLTWRGTDPDTEPPVFSAELPRLAEPEIFLAVDDGDNSPLQPLHPRLLLPAHRLRFYRDTEAELRLLYGNPAATAPRYDLALLAPRLLGAAAHEVELAPVAAQGQGRGGGAVGILVWAILAVAVACLLLIAGRLLRGGAAEA